MKLIKGHFYKTRRPGCDIEVCEYIGRVEGYECQVCGGGHNAYCFNLYHRKSWGLDYETYCYGKEHLPEIIEDLGKPEKPILAWEAEA